MDSSSKNSALKESLDFLFKTLTEEGVNSDNSLKVEKFKQLSKQKHKPFIYVKSEQQVKISNTKALSFETSDSKDKITNIQEKIKNFGEGNEKLKKLLNACTLRQNLEKGDKFKNILKVNKVFGQEGETVDIVHTPGEILFIDFWATWCGPCQKPMQHNQTLLEKNKEKWANKVRIVGVSLDETLNAIKKRVEDRKWTSIEHYQVAQAQNDKELTFTDYNVDGIPTVFLFDQNGILVYEGHPSQINLENQINKLLEKNDNSNDQVNANKGLDKQTYKNLLENIENLFEKKIEQLNKDIILQFSVQFSKHKLYNFERCIVEKIYSKPILKYIIDVKFLSQFQPILDELFAKFPKENFDIQQEVVEDSEKSLTTAKVQIQHLLKENELQDIDISYNSFIMFQPRYNNKFVDDKFFSQQTKISLQQQTKVEQFNKSLDQYISDSTDNILKQYLENFRLIAQLNKGDQFVSFKAFKLNLESKNEPQENEPKNDVIQEQKEKKEEEEKEEKKKEPELIQHNSGQILFLDFWATWCGPCQGPMKHNKEMIEKFGEQWGDKVRIVAVSLDDSEEEVVNRVNEQKWTNFEQYQIKDDLKNQALKSFGVRFIPHLVLIGQDGKIQYSGQPDEIKVEEEINKLLGQNEQQQQQKEEQKESSEDNKKKTISEDQFNSLFKLLESRKQEIFEFIKSKNQSIQLEVSLEKNQSLKHESSQNQVTYKAINLCYSLTKDQYDNSQKIKDFIEQILKIVPQNQWEKFNEKFLETTTIKLGQNCSVCTKELLATSGQFYCKFCNVYLCEECGEKTDETKKGNSKYLHPCNLVYIKVDNESGLQNIENYKFGENIKFETDANHHSFGCNGCDGESESAIKHRYICLTCRPGPEWRGGFCDLCFSCFKKIQNRNENQEDCKKVYEKIQTCAGCLQHDNNHVYLRICFAEGNYYKY